MPFHNCESYLDDSIQSILGQSFTDFEYIIINDASIDTSHSIVQKYLTDTRIVYIKNEKNQWIVKNLNYGISIAQWEYIARMDGDDISLPERLDEQLRYLEENPDISYVGSFADIIDEGGRAIWKLEKPTSFDMVKRSVFLYSCFIHPSILIRKKVLLDNNIYYREKYLYCEDYDLWLRLTYTGFKWENIAKVLLKYRKHTNSSNKNAKLIAERNLKLRKEMIRDFSLSLTITEYLWMYVHYLSGILLNGRQKEMFDACIKNLFYK